MAGEQEAGAAMSVTSIEWTDRNWPWARGCSMAKGSELGGCLNCYAARMAARFPWGRGFARNTKNGPRWTGRVTFQPQALDEPLRVRKPQRWFPSTFDPFHESLDFNDIAAVYGVMAMAHWHTFQVLTKRPERRLEFHRRLGSDPARCCVNLADVLHKIRHYPKGGAVWAWPLPNVWEGTSVEDQATADERVPLLLQTPAAVRWVSYEPALGPVNFNCVHFGGGYNVNVLFKGRPFGEPERLDWIVVGGESGPGARPFDVVWARSTVAQCRSAGVPVFYKQGGSSNRCAHSSKGGHFECFPAELKVREFPQVSA